MRTILSLITFLAPTVLPAACAVNSYGAEPLARPNILLILADDLGFSDLGCYGSEIATPNLDRLAARGLRFTQFYNCARCCPTRAALLSGLYPHQAGVGHMLGNWRAPGYTTGLNDQCATIAELLHNVDYRTYHVGKWHVGGVGAAKNARNHPMNRGFDRAYGTGGGGNYFALRPLYLDREEVEPGADFYATDTFTDYAMKFLAEHGREHQDAPFFMHLCYTAPHFPLHARPEDIARYRGKYRDGWDRLRERRFAKQKELGISGEETILSPRDPVAKAWADVPEAERGEWDLRMAVYAAMIDRLDQGVGRVLEAVRQIGAERNTLCSFFPTTEPVRNFSTPGRIPRAVISRGAKQARASHTVVWKSAGPMRPTRLSGSTRCGYMKAALPRP